MSLLVALLLSVDGGVSPTGTADAGFGTRYAAQLEAPLGLIELYVRPGGKALFRTWDAQQKPAVLVESLEVTVSNKGQDLCLEPRPRTLDVACLIPKDGGLEGTFKGKKLLLLEKR